MPGMRQDARQFFSEGASDIQELASARIDAAATLAGIDFDEDAKTRRMSADRGGYVSIIGDDI
jgi:hypothetical protein